MKLCTDACGLPLNDLVDIPRLSVLGLARRARNLTDRRPGQFASPRFTVSTVFQTTQQLEWLHALTVPNLVLVSQIQIHGVVSFTHVKDQIVSNRVSVVNGWSRGNGTHVGHDDFADSGNCPGVRGYVKFSF